MPIWLMAAGAICVVVVARCAARQKHALLGLLASAVCGVAGLAAVALLAPYTGVTLPLNPFTGFAATVLGVPVVVGVLLLQLLL